jgi:hypothetical protein
MRCRSFPFCLLQTGFILEIFVLQGYSSDRNVGARANLRLQKFQPKSVDAKATALNIFGNPKSYFSVHPLEAQSPVPGCLMFRAAISRPFQLSLRGGAKERDLKALRKKAEAFWIPVIEKLHGKTRQIWESTIWDIIELESSGEWGRIQPGEPEEDFDEDILDLINSDADGSGRRSTYDAVGGSEKGRMASAALAEQLGNAGANCSEIEKRWWDSVDQDNVDRELLVEWFEETTCCGVGNHSWQWQRFGGERRRCRAHFASDDETDEDMILRHFAGYEDNATLAGLRRLKIATKLPAPPHHRHLAIAHRCQTCALAPVRGVADQTESEATVRPALLQLQLQLLLLLLLLLFPPSLPASACVYAHTERLWVWAFGALGYSLPSVQGRLWRGRVRTFEGG